MSEGGFEAFARVVGQDAELAARLRSIDEPAALVAAAVEEGTARGLPFTASEMEAAMHANRHGWLMHPTPILPLPPSM